MSKATTDNPYAHAVRQMIERAEKGDEAARAELKAFLDENPDFWKGIGDLGTQLQGAIIELIAKDHPLIRESLERQLAEMKTELMGPTPTPLERLLVQRVVSCWLQLQEAELAYANARGVSLKQAEILERRVDGCNKRYMKAIHQLATTRKLLGSGA